MHKSCQSHGEVMTACVSLGESFLEINKRDLATPRFEVVEPALQLMASLDTMIKKLFIQVIRNPDKLRRAPASVIRFVHESMDFLENGTKRSINIEEWSLIITSVLETQGGVEKVQLTPTGKRWLYDNISVGRTTLFKPHDSINGVKEISPCILLHKWLQRDQGLKDALISYQLLGRIYANYCH